jgi:glutamate-1-semialdehyde 2,1-aminomutase
MEKYNTQKSKELYNKTKKYLVDGCSSSFHKASVEEYPVCISYGKGSKLYDIDGNEYIDYVGGFGPMILGYANDKLNEAAAKQIDKGTHFSAPTPELHKLSKRITEIIPCAEMVSFQSSGTEANMHVFRVARAFTNKDKIVKFEGQYHGWSDEQKITIGASSVEDLGPKSSPYKLLGSAGQKQSSGDDLIIMPWNDLDVLEKLFKERSDEIAAVITEPYMCDEGPIMPQNGYLKGLRDLTAKYGILLIFDEVITGFRMALGGAQEYYGVTPDLAVFGKAIAGGYSLSMICGKEEIMNCGVHPSGTFNATPLAVAAALETIDQLSQPGVYENFAKLGTKLADGIMELGKKHNVKTFAVNNGSICQMQIGVDYSVEDFRDYLENADVAKYNKLFLACSDYGIRITSARGRLYLSTAHSEEDIDKTLDVFDYIFPSL